IFPLFAAFCASERVLNRQDTSSQTSSRTSMSTFRSLPIDFVALAQPKPRATEGCVKPPLRRERRNKTPASAGQGTRERRGSNSCCVGSQHLHCAHSG